MTERASVVQTERYLVLDIGHVWTRALLFDVAEGRYVLVGVGRAPSTWEAPLQDVREGVLQAVEQLEHMTGLVLEHEGEWIIPRDASGRGVDKILLVTSLGPPMRVAAMGVLERFSLHSALRAMHNMHVQVVAAFHVNDGLNMVQRLERLLNARPEVIVLAGGTDEGAQGALREYIQVLELAAPLFPKADRPTLIYAGNRSLHALITQRLGSLYPLQIAENVRPTLDREHLADLRRVLLEQQKKHLRRHVPGLEGMLGYVQRWDSAERAWRFAAQWLAGMHGVSHMLGLYIGAGRSWLLHGPVTAPHMHFEPYGLGHGLQAFASHLDETLLQAWALQHDAPLADVYMKTVYPELLPETEAELWLECGLTYQIGRHLLLKHLPAGERQYVRGRGLPGRYNWILVAGGVWQNGTPPAQALLTALDILQPEGPAVLLADRAQLLAPLGVLAQENALAATHIARSSHVLPLATVLAVWGRMRGGRPVAEVRLQWDERPGLSQTVLAGELQALGLPPGYRARMEARPGRNVRLGARTGPVRAEVLGGWLGVVVDARGRPLRLPKDPEAQQQQRREWLRRLQVA